MHTEIEAKFFVVKEKVMNDIQRIGAQLAIPERMMRCKHFDTPDKKIRNRGGWIRVRDEGNKITLAYKELNEHSVTGMKEIEVVIDDFAAGEAFLESIGFVFTHYQEMRRESWILDAVHIDIDTWPWLPPLIEIESPNEEKLWSVAKALCLVKEQAMFGCIEIVYMTKYGISQEEFFSI